MAQNTDKARFFGDSSIDLNLKASRRRYGTERADPSTLGVSGKGGARPRRRNRTQRRSEAVEIRRQKNVQVRLRTMILYICECCTSMYALPFVVVLPLLLLAVVVCMRTSSAAAFVYYLSILVLLPLLPPPFDE